LKNLFLKLDFKEPKINIDVKLKTHNPKNDIGVSAYLHKNKIWEPFETSLIIKIINKKEYFVDVGANIGYYSLLSSKLLKSGGMVYSFEPELKNIEIFKENIKENKVQNVVLFENACSNNDDPIYLTLSKNNLGDHRVSKNKNLESKNIAPIVLDDVYKKFNFIPDLVKIDTQGYEFNILSGSQSLLSQSNTKTIFIIEFWPKGLQDQNYSLSKLINLINKNYFSFFALFEENKTIFNISIDHLLDWSKTIMSPSTDRYMNIIFGHSSNKEIKALKSKAKQEPFVFNKKNYAVNTKNNLSKYFIPLGWSYPEHEGVWTNGHFSKIFIEHLIINKNKKYSLSFKIYLSEICKKIPYFNLYINHNLLQTIKPDRTGYIEYIIAIPNSFLTETSIITFENLDIVNMRELTNRVDPRDLCLFMQYFMITENN
jgi:FkbM family methyltransferase